MSDAKTLPADGGDWCNDHDQVAIDGKCVDCPAMPAPVPAQRDGEHEPMHVDEDPVEGDGAPRRGRSADQGEAPDPETAPREGLVERIILAFARGAAIKKQASANAREQRLDAEARLVAAKAADRAAQHAEEATDEEEVEPEHPTLPWPAIMLIIALGTVFYLVFYSLATFGQGLMLSHPRVAAMLSEHVDIDLTLEVGMIIGGTLEFASIFFLAISIIQRILGDRAAGTTIASWAFAIMSIGVNTIGHAWLGDPFGALLFGLFSVTAFLGAALLSELMVRQIQRKRGIRDYTPPRLGYRLWRNDFDLWMRTREAYRAKPALKKQGALQHARDERETERRQATREQQREQLRELLRQNALDKYPNHPLIAGIEIATTPEDEVLDIMMARANANEIVAEIEALKTLAKQELADRMRSERTAEKRAELAAEVAVIRGEPVAESTAKSGPEKPGFAKRAAARVGSFLGAESTPNTAEHATPSDTMQLPKIDPDAVPGKRPKKGCEYVPIIPVDIDLTGMNKEQRTEAAERWLDKELEEGGDVTGTFVESKFNLGSDYSKGGTGGTMIRKVRNRLTEQAKEGVK